MAAPKLRDVRKLADSRAVFDLDVKLAALPDFPAEYAAGGGSVKAQLAFGREQGIPVMDDQGSGALIAPELLGLPSLRGSLRDSVRAGCDDVSV